MRYVLILMAIIFSGAAHSSGPHYKYSRGDCITPTDKSYSWYGEFAVVEAVSEIDGFSKGKKYILAFPGSASNNAIFGKEIEAASKLVDGSKCGDGAALNKKLHTSANAPHE